MVSTITLYVTGPYHITKVFARYKAVRHIKIVHENAKPFTCLICHQTFGLNVNLKTHVEPELPILARGRSRKKLADTAQAPA